MRLLVRELETKTNKLVTRKYRSWGHYKTSRGYNYPDPPGLTYESAIELVEMPCSTCWGQGSYYSKDPDGEGYARLSCYTCLGSGFRITLLV